MSLLILSASIFFQFAAAVATVRLVRSIGHTMALGLIAFSLILMGIQGAMTWVRIMSGDRELSADPEAEWVTLLISGMMLAGIVLIGRNWRKAQSNAGGLAFEQNVGESEKKFRTVIDSTPDPLIITDTSGVITIANNIAEITFGYVKGELVGKPIELLLPENLRSQHIGLRSSFVEKPSNRSMGQGMDLIAVKKSGEEFPVEISLSSIETGDELWIAASVRDISDRKCAEQKLDDAYSQISSSIEYASNIQKILLPDDDTLGEALGNHFVVWEPKDVVGGDFYWIRDWGEGRLLALGDCTGHGVPGAFMTLIATATLNRSLRETPPGQLRQLMGCINGRIQTVLGQDAERPLSDDGMEVGMVYMPNDNDSVFFCGAGFSLFVKSAEAVEECKGSRDGVGFISAVTDQTYEVTQISRSNIEALFLASDGVFDQTGGKRGHGFGKRRFKNAVLAADGLEIFEQGESLINTLRTYQGDEPRRDDVTIIGFQLSDVNDEG